MQEQAQKIHRQDNINGNATDRRSVDDQPRNKTKTGGTQNVTDNENTVWGYEF